MEKGYVQIYTGSGKGKTTAALGLALRAACSGLNVYIGQFLKGFDYSELKLVDHFSNITIDQYGRDYFIKGQAEQKDKDLADIGFSKVKEILQSDQYDLVILDEICIALMMNLVDEDELIELLKNRKPGIEVVLTGINASEKLIDFADLVTEMKEVKHYYKNGVIARKGIEN